MTIGTGTSNLVSSLSHTLYTPLLDSSTCEQSYWDKKVSAGGQEELLNSGKGSEAEKVTK